MSRNTVKTIPLQNLGFGTYTPKRTGYALYTNTMLSEWFWMMLTAEEKDEIRAETKAFLLSTHYLQRVCSLDLTVSNINRMSLRNYGRQQSIIAKETLHHSTREEFEKHKKNLLL